MAQAGYTPIQLYYSTTTSNVPSAGNLASGELAINITDGKLFYKDNGGVVRVIAQTSSVTNVASISFGTTGLTPSTATTGAVTVAGTLATTNGGTGLTSFTANRVFYASSTSAIGQSANLTFDGTTLTAANFTDSSLTSGRVTYATTGGNLTDSANLTFDGTNLTLGGGTANGVAYLNGSKVLTTGGTLTFDGTTLRTGTSSTTSPGIKVNMDGVGTQTYFALTSDPLTIFSIYRPSGANNLRFDANYGGFVWGLGSAGTATEAMALTSTGLGIGTSSPAAKLDVLGASSDQIRVRTASTEFYRFGRNSSTGFLDFYGSQTGYQGYTFGGVDGTWATINSSGNVGIGTTSPLALLSVGSGAISGRTALGGASLSLLSGTYATTGGGSSIEMGNGHGNSGDIASWIMQSVVVAGGGVTRNNELTFSTRTAFSNVVTERMRITSAGDVGIGTSSPAYKLDVVGEVRANNLFRTTDGTNIGLFGSGVFASGVVGIGSSNSVPLVFGTGATERMRLDSSGNLGLGVTPSAWSVYKSFDSGSCSFNTAGVQGELTSNGFFNASSQWIYKTTGFANRYVQNLSATGAHAWFTAASGTAGNAISFTQAMTLDATGDLALGRTSVTAIGSGYRTVDLDGSNGSGIKFRSNGTLIGNLYAAGTSFLDLGTAGAYPLTFTTNGTERARITSTGAWSFGSSGTATGTSGQVLTSNGSGSAPTWQNAGGGGSWVLISSVSASSSATVSFTSGIDSTYAAYVVVISNAIPAGDDDLYMQISSNGGSTYITTSYDNCGLRTQTGSTTLTGVNQANDGGFRLCGDRNVFSGTGTFGISSVVYLFGPSVSKRQQFLCDSWCSVNDNNTSAQLRLSSVQKSTTTYNAIKFYFASQNISSGRFSLYGIKHT